MSDNIYKNQKWGVHIVGPDNVIPCHSFEQAVDQAHKFNITIGPIVTDGKFFPVIFAQVDTWECIAGPGAVHDPENVDWEKII